MEVATKPSLHFTIESDDEVEQEVFSDSGESDHEAESEAEAEFARTGELAEQKLAKKSVNNKVASGSKLTNSFFFDFDDGQVVLTSRRPSDIAATKDRVKVTNDKSKLQTNAKLAVSRSDSVRPMPHGQERIARAAAKALAANQNAGAAPAKNSDDAQDDDDDDASVAAGSEASPDQVEEEYQQYFESIVDASAKATASASGANSSEGIGTVLFSQLNLSRPLLRAVEQLGFVSASPIQARVIPLALAGRDVCASAETGSGKTAAFLLPSLERLLYRPRNIASTRILVVTPTRELASQIHSVLQQLAQFTDVTAALVCGGKKDLRSQEAILRQRPDVIVCTPGRLLDHLRNSASVRLDELDVLVLDEADRLLELGFQDEVEELLSLCSATAHSRQTMLFSATMTARVDDLARLSLKKPVRVKTTQTAINFAARLVQEFVKIRAAPGAAAELEVEATLLALVCRNFGKHCIVFFEQKRNAHRFCALLQLTGQVAATELHGDIPQAQRDTALGKFRSGEVDVLVATDVAARGLDIAGVQTVLSAEMPRNPSIYVHRVGRTARAGCGGRAITLVSDARRKVMKEVLKGEAGVLQGMLGGAAALQILSRTVPGPVLSHYTDLVRELEPQLGAHFKREREQAKLDRLLVEAERAENLLLHAEEIKARPARTWFQSEGEKHRQKVMSKEVAEQEQQQQQHQSSRQQLSAAERIAAFAQADAYPTDLNPAENSKKAQHDSKHRLTRKKRRRQEALQQESEDTAATGGADGQTQDDSEINAASKFDKSMEVSVKRKKVSLRDKEQERLDKPIGMMGLHTRVKQRLGNEQQEEQQQGNEKRNNSKNSKADVAVVRRSIAVGGLGQDYIDWGLGAAAASGGSGGAGGMSKKQIKQAAKEKPFTDFDPTRQLRKGGKVGSKAFKSKAKYKRRK